VVARARGTRRRVLVDLQRFEARIGQRCGLTA